MACATSGDARLQNTAGYGICIAATQSRDGCDVRPFARTFTSCFLTLVGSSEQLDANGKPRLDCGSGPAAGRGLQRGPCRTMKQPKFQSAASCHRTVGGLDRVVLQARRLQPSAWLPPTLWQRPRFHQVYQQAVH